MKVADLMHKDVQTVRSGATVAEVLLTLADSHISAVPVVDEHGRMIGVVSTTDVILAEAEAGDDKGVAEVMEGTQACDIMTPRVLTIAPDADVKQAAEHMLYGDVHRLFVTDGDRRVGVISTTDIVRAVATGRI